MPVISKIVPVISNIVHVINNIVPVINNIVPVINDIVLYNLRITQYISDLIYVIYILRISCSTPNIVPHIVELHNTKYDNVSNSVNWLIPHISYSTLDDITVKNPYSGNY